MGNQVKMGISNTVIAAETQDTTTDERRTTSLPEHLVSLPDSGWALWRWTSLRGAGFPAAQILELGAPDCAAAADRLVESQIEADQARRDAMQALRNELNVADGDKRDRLEKSLRRLRKGNTAQIEGVSPLTQEAIDAFRAANAGIDQATADVRDVYERSVSEASQVIQRVARTPRFREAVIWQNRHALHGSIDALLRMPEEGGSRGADRRKREELVANYLQRYCLKNDTIGFFGPVGWGRFNPVVKGMIVRPGPELLATRRVYFENWSISALAESLVSNKGLRPWVAPRRAPFIHLDKTTLYLASERPAKLSVLRAALLHSCDGERTAKQIAANLLRALPGQLTGEADVYRLLEELEALGLISWALEVPICSYPERELYPLLQRIGDERVRAESLEALDELDAARNAVALAAGDPEKLDQAFGDLEATFTRLTGVASTRSAGKTYAARTLVYEDCMRDIEIEIGQEIIESLAAPLSLLLTSARWFVFQAGQIYKATLRSIYDELLRTTTSPAVGAVPFWIKLQPILFGQESGPLDSLTPDFQRRWMKILSISSAQSSISYSSEALRPRVLAEFDVPASGWRFARYHSPDVMIAANSVEAIERGEYQLVLGELHLGANTLSGSCFTCQHPDPEQLFRAVELDHPEPRVLPVVPRQWPKLNSRTRPSFASPNDFHLAVSADSVVGSKARALQMGSFVIEDSGEELIARTRDGQMRFPLTDFFAVVLASTVVNLFKIIPSLPRTPRITFDKLVVCRESWSFSPREVEFAFEKTEVKRFTGARSWVSAHGIPRFAFAKAPVEIKPFYVDFTSPIYVEMFARTVRRSLEADQGASLISVNEMLPGADRTWLPDAKDRRHTSEFRIVALDLAK